jgi:hypothetical protein
MFFYTYSHDLADAIQMANESFAPSGMQRKHVRYELSSVQHMGIFFVPFEYIEKKTLSIRHIYIRDACRRSKYYIDAYHVADRNKTGSHADE